ncbi:MAG: UvrD-helicase domain-containing protein, partial [Alphaproteobacteria bacterium]|nr:UvrD-helicase domain-containing protein [Alphaproteobacteria bacterium]
MGLSGPAAKSPRATSYAIRAPMVEIVPESLPPYLRGLNPPQLDAVRTLDGPLLVLAGAGTGKTRVLTTRIAHLLVQRKAFPGQVLAVTFTNKAAAQMRERVASIIGETAEGMWLGTFHALAARILRRHAELAGLKSNFTILDQDDQIRLIKQLLQAEGIDDKRWPARVVHGVIERWKDRGLTPQRVTAESASEVANGRAVEIYAMYQERLKTLNAVDFGDLLLHTLTIFQNDASVLAEYHRKFKYILVDEYQDTNVAQYLWLRILAQGHRNICCVGDDDQSIYGWRGAEVGNILRFE